MKKITGFKAYDFRGRIPTELNPDVAYRIGRAYAEFRQAEARRGRPRHPPVEPAARDCARHAASSTPASMCYDIGLCGTEVVYFATFAEGIDGGIMVTASHNPPDYNGMKFVREQSRPISGDTGLKDIAAHRRGGRVHAPAQRRHGAHDSTCTPEYIEHLLSLRRSREAASRSRSS